MTREEIIQIVEEASTRSIIMFLEREDNDTYPNALPSARIVRDNVVFSMQPTMKDGSAADWRMRRSKEDLLEGYTWFSIGTFRGNGTQVDAWTDPVLAKIGRDGAPGTNGAPGGDGADGTSIEYIFRLAVDETQFNDFATPYSEPNTTGYVPTVDNGGVPESDVQYGDWADRPDGVTLEHKVEAMCYRKRDIETHQWSEFYGPYKWSVWGNNGRDGDGVEYIFRLATLDGEDAEAEYDTATGIYRLKREYWPPTDQASYDALTPEEKEAYDRTDIEYYPEGWIDDPLDVNDDYPVQFVSVRKYDGTKKKWGFFSEPTCWNKIPLTDSIVTAFTALAFCVTAKDISNYKPVGGSAMDPDPDDFDYEGEHITWSDSIPSVGNGFVWMTTSVWRDGEITEKGWSYPMKVNDSPGFQAEYSNDYPWDSAERPKLPNFGEYNEDEAAWRAAAEAAGCGIWKDCKYDDPEHYISDPAFMATCQKKDGVWTDWVVTKIKGENGLSPVYLHIGNDTIAVGIDDNNKTVASVQQTITAEIQIGGDELDIDPTKAIFKTIDGGNLPSGFEVLNPRVDTSGKKFMVEIIVPQDFDLTQQFKIKMSIVAEGFDAYNIIRVVGVPGGDGASYSIKIDGGYIDIDRTFTSTGACVYTPAVLKCHGERIIGLNDPIPYGYIKYSVSTNMEDYKFDVLDVYTPQEGVFDYTDGIVIDNLQDHQNLKAIYLYLVNENNLVIDTEIVEIDTKGEYFINLETDKIVTDNGTVKPSSVKVWTGYRSNKTDPGTYIDSHVLKYYINGDSTNMKTSVNRNNNAIQITSLDGWNISTTKTITFVLTTTNGAILTDPKSISVTEQPADGTPGSNGTSITNTFNYFKLAGENETLNSPPNTASRSSIISTYGWSETALDLTSSKPILWQFIRVEYSDGSAKHLAAFPCRYYNTQANITYNDVNSVIQEELDISLTDALNRLEDISDTTALIEKYPDKGLLKLITQYADSDGTKSFADYTADAATATIATIVGSTINDVTTTAGQKINGIDGKVTTFAEQLKGVDQVEGAVQQLATNAITQAVTKSHYVWRVKEGVTLPEGQPKYLPYTSDDDSVNKTLYEKALVSDAMSTIKVEADKISLLTGTDGNFKAGIQIIANAANVEPIYNPVTKQTVPAGSAIVLDANNVIINGNMFTGYLEANAATIQQLVADSVTANSLETGDHTEGTMGTYIHDGSFEVYYQQKKRVEMGVSNGDIVLKFYDSSGVEQYDLGPSGFRDKDGHPVYEGTF